MIEDHCPLVQMVLTLGRQAIQAACWASADGLPLGRDISVRLELSKRAIEGGALDLGIRQGIVLQRL
jgi:hypothetical protein